MHVEAKYTVAAIENGFLITDNATGRVFHEAYRHGIGPRIERLFHDLVVERLADQDAIERLVVADAAHRVDGPTHREAFLAERAAAGAVDTSMPMQQSEI